MNEWKKELSPQVKQILKDINDVKKIEKDCSYLSHSKDIPESHIPTLKGAYFNAIRCQLLILHSSLDAWFMDGAEVKCNE